MTARRAKYEWPIASAPPSEPGAAGLSPGSHNQVVLHATPSHSAALTESEQRRNQHYPHPQEYIYGDDDDDGSAGGGGGDHRYGTQELEASALAVPADDASSYPTSQHLVIQGSDLVAPLPTALRIDTDVGQTQERISFDANGSEVREQVITMPDDGGSTTDAPYTHVHYEPASETRADTHGADGPPELTKIASSGEHMSRDSISNALGLTTKNQLPVLNIKLADDAPPRPMLASRGGADIMYAYRPYMTAFVGVAWIVLFIVSFGTDSWTLEDPYINPAIGPRYQQLDDLGGKITFKILGHEHGTYGSDSKQTYRIITSIFWHAGIIHFLPSLFGLVWLGIQIEREYGPFRLLLLLVASGLYGTIFSSIFSVDLLTVSASACVFGLIGARAVDAALYRHWYTRTWRIGAALVAAAAVGMIIGCLPLVDNWAHIGGALMGALLAGSLFTGGWRPSPDIYQSGVDLTGAVAARTPRYHRVRLACLSLCAAAWIVTVIMLFVVVKQDLDNAANTDTDVWCQGCNQLQCVNAPSWTCRPTVYYG